MILKSFPLQYYDLNSCITYRVSVAATQNCRLCNRIDFNKKSFCSGAGRDKMRGVKLVI